MQASLGEDKPSSLEPKTREAAIETTETLESAAPEAPARSSASSLEERILLTLACACIGFLLFQLVTFGHGRDQGIYTMVARSLLKGGMPYRDAWDFKPPGIFLIYALARALFGPAEWGIRVLEAAGLALTSLGLVRLSRQFWGDGRIGVVAAVVNALVHVQLDFWHTAQPESFGGMITVAALLCAPVPNASGRFFPDATSRGRWIAAGALFGFAGLLKPPLIGGAAITVLLPAFAALSAHSGGSPLDRLRCFLRASLRPALFLSAGGLIPIGLCAAWFFARGALGDLYQVLFVFTPHYTKLGWVGSTVTGMLYWAFTEWFQSYGSVITAGLLLALGVGISAKERPFAALLGGVIAIHLIGVAMQAKFFPYHYGATWPITSLLAGLGFFKLWERAREKGLVATIGFYLFVLVIPFGRSACKDVPWSFLVRTGKRVDIAMAGFQDQAARDILASVADVDATSNRRVAELFKKHTAADRKVFVWGFEPQIYNLADRDPATRYIYDVPQRVTWAKEPHRRVLLDELRRNRPAAIAVEHRDVFPFVTGDAIDSADTLYDYWDLYAFISDRYELIDKTEKFDVYIERP